MLQLGSRDFGFYRDGRTDLLTSHLVPLADLINHDDDNPLRRLRGQLFRRIKQGDEGPRRLPKELGKEGCAGHLQQCSAGVVAADLVRQPPRE